MIHVYLRASTQEQDATRAQDTINSFLAGFGVVADMTHVENASGAKLERPVLSGLLDSVSNGDIIVIEQVDRLTRLEQAQWEQLKTLLNSKGVVLVSMDLPTSHALLTPQETSDFTRGIMAAINGLMLDILALTARKDYEDRRRRQAEGIARNKDKFKGKQVSAKSLAKFTAAVAKVEQGYKVKDAATLCGVSVSGLYKFIKESK